MNSLIIVHPCMKRIQGKICTKFSSHMRKYGKFTLQKKDILRLQICNFSSVNSRSQYCSNMFTEVGFPSHCRAIYFTPKRGFKARDAKPEIEKWEEDEPPKSGPKHCQQKSEESGEQSAWSLALKGGLYTAGFAAFVFGGCAIWQLKNAKRDQEFWKDGLQKQPLKKQGEVRRDLNNIWNHLSTVHKITYSIIGLNFLVWGAWKLGNPQTMMKWFTLSATNSSHRFVTMLLSAFSHKNFIHFYVNMFVLSSFCAVWNQLALKNYWSAPVNTPERYVAFYLTAAMCGSLFSIFIKTLGRIPQASLGASGAIMGLIGYTCEKLPNNLLSIVFLPNFTFTADSAKKFIICFDSIGLLIGAMTKWRYMVFDHAGHLGGMLFGIWYAMYGEQVLHNWSEFVMDKWRGKD